MFSFALSQNRCCTGLFSPCDPALHECPGALGVQSIYQPWKTTGRSESPRFAGFFACFLEWAGRGL